MSVRILRGDCRLVLKDLPDESVHCCISSPPYFGLRDYGVDGQIGLEQTPESFVAELVEVFREVRRVLRSDGTLWLNLGDSYAGSGRGGNPTEASSTLEGSQTSQQASMVRRSRDEIGGTAREAAVTNHANRMRPLTVSQRRDDAMVPRSDQRHATYKPKDLMGMPWEVARALRMDGWFLRQDIIWAKPNPMPESVTDRCTKSHEYLFLLSKSERYFYDADAIAEPVTDSTIARMNQPGLEDQAGSDRVPGKTNGTMKAVLKSSGNLARKPSSARGAPEGTGKNQAGSVPWEGSTRNKRSVWTVATQPFSEAHFATFPPALIEPCVLAGCPEGGTILDPFGGAGTTGLVADRLGRNCLLIELNPSYADMAERRLRKDAGLFAEVSAT